MKIEFPKITREIDLGDYQPEFAGQVLMVWVNPPLSKLAKYDVLADTVHSTIDKLGEAKEAQVKALADKLEKANQNVYSWWADILSQDEEPDTYFSADDVQALAEASLESDPGLWAFIQTACMKSIAEYRSTRKKG